MNRIRHVCVARSVVGRLVSKTNGFARVATSGTRSTREESAHRACISGLKRSASLAVDGRRIPTGIRTEQGVEWLCHSSVFLDFVKLPSGACCSIS